MTFDIESEMKLSNDQIAIARIVSSRHLVLAPPGSGKTELLAQRMLKALETGSKPETMVCLTFTNRAARNMQERIRDRAQGHASGAFVGNFHAFGVKLLRGAGILTSQHVVLDEEDDAEFSREALGVVQKKQGRTMDDKSAKKLVDILSVWRKAEVCKGSWCPKPVQAWAEARLKEKLGSDQSLIPMLNEALLVYDQLKEETRAFDFDDLLLYSLKYLVETPFDARPLRPEWAQVDEAQDLNELQWEILTRMLAPDAHLCVFADPMQAIFSFMGAELHNFQSRVKGYEVHDLTNNYRSPESLLAFLRTYAQEVLGKTMEWKSMVPASAEAHPIQLLEPKSSDEEKEVLGDRVIPSLLAKGGGVAVLSRMNKEIKDLSDHLTLKAIPHFRVADFDLFRLAVAKDFMAALEACARPESRLPWARMLAMSGGTPSIREGRHKINAAHAVGVRPADFFREPSRFVWGPGRMAEFLRGQRVVVLDTETTGLDPAEDEVIQFAGVELVNGRPGRELSLLLKTERPLGETAKVHGITTERLEKEGVSREAGLNRIREFLGDAPILAFNLPFDQAMLEMDFRRTLKMHGFVGRHGAACVLEASRALLHKEPSHRLGDLLARLNVRDVVNSHDALDDARACAALAQRLAGLAESSRSQAESFADSDGGLAFLRLAQVFRPMFDLVNDDPHGEPISFDDIFKT